jgi:uncharacterized protein (DUF58 family)
VTAAPPVVAETTTTLEPSRDGRLVPWCVIALGGLAASILTGQPALAALASPFVLALALGLRRRGPIQVRARVALHAAEVLEGDAVTGRIELEWDEPLEARMILHRLRGFGTAGTGSAPSWSLPVPGRRIEAPLRLEARQWGRHAVGEVWLRLDAPFGLLAWTGRVLTGPMLRVLPGSERLSQLLDPAESGTVLGTHRSRRPGDGHEFAELRPYVPGDRLRNLNWAATARHRRPLVNIHHPERPGDVVIAIDAFADGSAASTVALGRAARAAWALASAHLRANDRVGVVGLGGSTRWLAPAGGQRARYQLLETLLDIGAEAADPLMSKGETLRRALPPSALILALTPLHDARTLRSLEEWRSKGRAVTVVLFDPGPAGPAGTAAEALARRLWRLELARRQRTLTELGIPVIPLAGDGPIGPAISALRRVRRPARKRVGR